MGVNKVVYGTTTIIDISDSTVAANKMLKGIVAYGANGDKVTGNIETKTSSNLSASGKTVTVPAGYYASNATKDVSTVTRATPSISVSSAGVITASATQTAGYVSAGTESATKQLTTQGAKTVTPTTSEQTVVASGVYTTGAIKVGKIPSNYIVPSGTKAITTNGTHDVSSYASVTVNVAGASLPSCTVNFDLDYQSDTLQVYYTSSDGKYKHVQLSQTETITDVLCGSIIQVHCDGYVWVSGSDLNTVDTDEETYYTFAAPSQSGAYTVSFDNS